MPVMLFNFFKFKSTLMVLNAAAVVLDAGSTASAAARKAVPLTWLCHTARRLV